MNRVRNSGGDANYKGERERHIKYRLKKTHDSGDDSKVRLKKNGEKRKRHITHDEDSDEERPLAEIKVSIYAYYMFPYFIILECLKY